MKNIVVSFYIILYIVIFDRIVLESLGILVSNDLFFAFYTTPNLYIVVWRYVSPGFKTTGGK